MDKPKNLGGRPKGIRYPKRLMVFETEQGIELLRALARKWDTAQAEVVRRLIRQAAREEGIAVERALSEREGSE